MKRNKFFVLGVLAAALTFGLVLTGCGTLKMDKATLVSETITLKSYVVKDLAVEWGYTDERKPLDFGPVVGNTVPVYPEALVRRFTAVEKDTGPREGVWIQTKTSASGWKVQQHIQLKDAETMETLGLFETENEAKAYADQRKEADPLWAFSIEVVPVTLSEEHEYVGLKPLQ